MNIGRQQPTACQCNHFSGVMDELRLWNVARSQAEIQANMHGEVPANSPGLGAYYKFNEGSGTTVSDATGNGNNGQLQGALQWVAASKNYPAYYGPGTWTYLVPAGVGFLKYQAWAQAQADRPIVMVFQAAEVLTLKASLYRFQPDSVFTSIRVQP